MVAGLFPPQIGGPATQVWHLCRALRAAGVAVVVVTVGGPPGCETVAGVPIHRVGLGRARGWVGRKAVWVEFAAALRRIFARERPDVVHCHDVFILSLVAGVVCRGAGIPAIVKYAGDMVWEVVNAESLRAPTFDAAYRAGPRARLLYLVQRIGLRAFDVVWAASEFQRGRLLVLGVADARIRVVPNLIHLPAPTSSISREGPPIVLTASRIVPHKRLELLVDVFSRIGPPAARLVIIGHGPTRAVAHLQTQAARLGVADRIEFTGPLANDEVIRHMRDATVYASTSIWEGFGIVFVEAMAVGLPIVAMKVGAIPEVVPDGRAGYLVDPEDAEGMADRLQRLLSAPSERRAMADFGRAHARRFDLEAHLDRFLDLYASVLRGRGS